MAPTNVDQVQELYRSFAEGDWARVLGCFAEDSNGRNRGRRASVESTVAEMLSRVVTGGAAS